MKAHSSDTVELGLAEVPDLIVTTENLRNCPLVFLDPIDEDQAGDPVAALTHRELLRLVFLAAETGGRFEREKIPADPVAWLLSPRAVFNGQAAVDACQGREAFLRGIILHGLSLGLDADPADIAALLAEDDDLAVVPSRPAPHRLENRKALSAA